MACGVRSLSAVKSSRRRRQSDSSLYFNSMRPPAMGRLRVCHDAAEKKGATVRNCDGLDLELGHSIALMWPSFARPTAVRGTIGVR